jgi:purine-cytosine permease-like protein
VLTEHFVFRKGRFDSYDIEDWDKPRRLPSGIAAILAFLCAFGIIIPTMFQAFYKGPIAKAGSGDIGVYTGAAMATLVYGALRPIEKRWKSKFLK